MSRYWENKSGYYDPVAKQVIDKESARNKEIRDTISEVKYILRDRDLILLERIILKDKRTEKIYR